MPDEPAADDAGTEASGGQDAAGGETPRWDPPMDPPDRPLRPPAGSQPRYEAEPRPPMAWPTDPARPVPGWGGPHPWVDPGASSPWAGATAEQPSANVPAGSAPGPDAGEGRPAGVPPMYPPSAFPPGGQGGRGGVGSPPPPPPPRLAPDNPDGPRRGRARLPIAVAVVLVLLAAAAGFGGGLLANQTRSSSSANGVNATVQQVTLQGSAAQPAAAVAKALMPAVVQLQTGNDLGSGFVYDPSGLILTAAHVVGSAHKIQVVLSDGTKLSGTVVGSDQGTDVAVVRIKPPSKLAVAALGSSNDVQVGETAIAIGSPFGLEGTVTQGIVSATGRPVQTQSGTSVPMIQTDAPINPGNSGGALANANGQVIGINDAIYTSSDSSGVGGQPGNVGVGFAIPIDLARSIAARLVAGEPVGSGYLGIEGGDSTGSQPGAVVQTVEPGTPADKAGLQQGDLITAVDGQPITSMGALASAITTHQPGDTVTLTVERDGKKQDVKVTLGNRSDELKSQDQGQGQNQNPFPNLIPGG